ncbi:hypothetical protein niasHT_034932 [Heterodera trifolii]|uniref:Uncharacterized protein n=1 Tax=Heterodera trifolii TaxID=157864 RepID=A0ABD2IBJ1_9BILA
MVREETRRRGGGGGSHPPSGLRPRTLPSAVAKACPATIKPSTTTPSDSPILGIGPIWPPWASEWKSWRVMGERADSQNCGHLSVVCVGEKQQKVSSEWTKREKGGQIVEEMFS